MLITLFLYIALGTIILFSKNKFLSIISCLTFGTYVFISRDIYAAPDSKFYLNFFVDDIFDLGSTITFKYYKSLLDNVLFLPGIISYHFSTIILFVVISLISIKAKVIYPIFFFLSSEAFSVLSFNGIRQGIAASLLIWIFYFFRRILFQESNFSRNSFFVFSLIILVPATMHSTIFGYLLLIMLLYFSSFCLKGIFNLFKNLKIKKLYLLLISLFLGFLSFSIYLTVILDTGFIKKAAFYLTNNETYNSGTIGSFYRLTVMVILVSYPFLRSNSFYIKKSFSDFMSNKFLFTSTISLLFLTPIAFIGAQLFIRFSYFYIIPIIFNFLYWKKKGSRNN